MQQLLGVRQDLVASSSRYPILEFRDGSFVVLLPPVLVGE